MNQVHFWCEKPQGGPALHQHVAEVSDRKVRENVFKSVIKKEDVPCFPAKATIKPFNC